MNQMDAPRPGGEIVVYQTEDGRSHIQVMLDGDTVWLTQNQIAELYQTTIPNINIHLRNIYTEGELKVEATVKDYLIVRLEGKRKITRKIQHYSLEMILAVGYRVKSPVATKFRQWATARLREYIVKGFVIDDERLKGRVGIVDYFDELLARIRDIRASEARVYQRIREIFALACDYMEGERETQMFFATMQNKMHYAATGMTAAEIVRQRADSSKPNMGLTSWKGEKVLKRDIVTAKNYLDEKEIDTLNRITVMFLDQAEFRAMRRQNIRMHDWEVYLDKFLIDTELPVLDGTGTISHEDAFDWAEGQYENYAEKRRIAAENAAEAHYVEDLRQSAKMLEELRNKKPIKTKTGDKPQNRTKKNDAEKSEE